MAWHLMGSLSKESYDREYSDSELVKRLIPYLFKYKLLISVVFITSILDSLFALFGPFVFAIGFDELFKTNPDLHFVIMVTLSYLVILILGGAI